MRRSKAAKKSIWQDLLPNDQFNAFCYGDVFAKNPPANHLSTAIYSCWTWADELKRKNPKWKLEIFTSKAEMSIDRDVQEIMWELFKVAVDASSTGNASQLRDIADAIEAGAKSSKPAVDMPRAILWTILTPEIYNPKRPVQVPKTFSQVRAEFSKKFLAGMDDAPLREMIREMGAILLPDKKGRPRKRNR